ncbi:hypothetical protein EBU94_05045 [bacterium]|nr:hypothetical protein [bacterium]
MATNLFKKAKATATTKTTDSKDKKTRIDINDLDFFENVQALEALQDRMKADKSRADIISDELKYIGTQEWVKLYDRTGKNPGSIMIETKSGLDTASIMFVPTDRYITITEARAVDLIERYGEEIVEEKTQFSFDNEMIEKYGEILSDLISTCPEIEEDDKGRIIKAVTNYSVSKGTIDKMKSYGDVSMIMEEVKPVVALKNIEVIKG